jgi:hypothetical protein
VNGVQNPDEPSVDPDPLDSGKLDWIWDGVLEAQGYPTADLVTLTRLLSRPCPLCRAGVGEWCRSTGSGTVLDHLDKQHVARRLL